MRQPEGYVILEPGVGKPTFKPVFIFVCLVHVSSPNSQSQAKPTRNLKFNEYNALKETTTAVA